MENKIIIEDEILIGVKKAHTPKKKPVRPKFKPGSELSDKVNMVGETIAEGEDFTVSVNIVVVNEKGEQFTVQSKKKMRFKAGADLTEKVNITEATDDVLLWVEMPLQFESFAKFAEFVGIEKSDVLRPKI